MKRISLCLLVFFFYTSTSNAFIQADVDKLKQIDTLIKDWINHRGLPLEDASIVSLEIPLSNAIIRKCLSLNLTQLDLRKANFTNFFFSTAFFSDSYLNQLIAPGCNFRLTHIFRCMFKKSNLSHAIFIKARLEDVNFVSANLFGANFSQAALQNLNFESTNLAYSRLPTWDPDTVINLRNTILYKSSIVTELTSPLNRDQLLQLGISEDDLATVIVDLPDLLPVLHTTIPSFFKTVHHMESVQFLANLSLSASLLSDHQVLYGSIHSDSSLPSVRGLDQSLHSSAFQSEASNHDIYYQLQALSALPSDQAQNIRSPAFAAGLKFFLNHILPHVSYSPTKRCYVYHPVVQVELPQITISIFKQIIAQKITEGVGSADGDQSILDRNPDFVDNEDDTAPLIRERSHGRGCCTIL